MAPLPQLTPGMLFARDYRVLRHLSAGGMGAVYVVEQVSTQRQRALKIIENCAHPDFKEPLREYVKLAEKKANGHHTPHDLATALGWHVRFLETGTMVP